MFPSIAANPYKAFVLAAIALFFPGIEPALTAEGKMAGMSIPQALTDADFEAASKAKANLGRLLFYDPVLSGNKNISCATCHHPDHATGDGVSLSIGEGGAGLGPDRLPVSGVNQPEQRIGRNSPALFNVGAREFKSFFHDGRLERDASRESGFRTPLEDDMVAGFDGPLAAQTMFPVLSGDEMAGHYDENEIAKAVRQGLIAGPGGAWERIAQRIRRIPEYVQSFVGAFDNVETADDIRFTDIANAIAAFVALEWRADDSSFDRYLRGDESAMGPAASAGMTLFYGKANCSICHSGPLQTDHEFHAIAMPQLGPGRTARFESHQRDIGRMRVTGKSDDAYRFRTPSLRNVELTAPYGHAGAYSSLEAVVRHHSDPVGSLEKYDKSQVVLADVEDWNRRDWAIQDNPQETAAIASANQLQPTPLSDGEIARLVSFLKSLTDHKSLPGRLGVPSSVPSGLPVD